MRAAGLAPRLKDPRRRAPTNRLRDRRRLFAFRRCAFHSPRAAVGQRPCPLDAADADADTCPPSPGPDPVPRPLFS
ncbi:hypothetical protein CDD83_2930 [Cordyceps sp. RAO-2017]|nr:hypothetical protein CDD83_2930 [Cordyceps sp. RAO-2017]